MHNFVHCLPEYSQLWQYKVYSRVYSIFILLSRLIYFQVIYINLRSDPEMNMQEKMQNFVKWKVQQKCLETKLPTLRIQQSEPS